MQNRRNRQSEDSEPLFFGGELEVRSNTAGDGEVIVGYYAVYNQRSHVMTSKRGIKFVEIIKPGAFDKTDFSEVESRFDHDRVLGAPPSLRHGTDQRGAFYEIDYDPLDPDHVSVMRKIKRGDIKGSSFEFSPPGPNDQTVSDESGIKLREIRHIPKVYEFGPVMNPAYRDTTVFMRSLDQQDEADLQAQQDFQKQKLEAQRFLAMALS